MRASTFAAVMLCTIPCNAAERPPERWYGWQIATADAIAVTAAGAGYLALGPSRSFGADVLVIGGGAALYLIVPPIIHAGHEQGTNALESLLVRAAAPILVGVSCKCGVGVAVGAGGAALADAALIAWMPAPSWRTSTAAFTPYAMPINAGATFGVHIAL